MARLILIDNNSGYIFGDTADLRGYERQGEVELDAIAAAAAIDADIGEHGRSYAFQPSKPRDTRSGYDVYRVDIDGSEIVPVVTDGQDQEIIDIVTSQGEYEGFVTCTDKQD